MMLPTLLFRETAAPTTRRSITVSEYSVKAYYLPRYSMISSSPGASNRLIDAVVKLQPSDWSIDLHRAFPNGTNTDSYFIGGPPRNWPTPPCYCSKMPKEQGGKETEEDNGECDQYWKCTAICKLRRDYQTNMKDQEKQYSEELGDSVVEYVLFVEGDEQSGQEDIPLLDRETVFELEVPMSERGMVMVRVERWIPVDVRPVIVNNEIIRNVGEDELLCLKRFLKTVQQPSHMGEKTSSGANDRTRALNC